MRKISRLRQQLASDIVWDPGKRKEEADRRQQQHSSDSTDSDDAQQAEQEEEDDDDEDRSQQQSSDKKGKKKTIKADEEEQAEEGEEEKQEEQSDAEEEEEHKSAAAAVVTPHRQRARPGALDSSLIITPAFRLLSDASSSPVKPAGRVQKFTLPSAHPLQTSRSTSSPPPAPSSPSTPTLSSPAFIRRHLPLARRERSIGRQQRDESTEHWIICDACKRWRLIPSGSPAFASPPSSYYCGGQAEAEPQQCARLDDWIVRCVGESRARQLQSVGVVTVEELPSRGRRGERERRMERLGMYFDRTTQKIRCF